MLSKRSDHANLEFLFLGVILIAVSAPVATVQESRHHFYGSGWIFTKLFLTIISDH